MEQKAQTQGGRRGGESTIYYLLSAVSRLVYFSCFTRRSFLHGSACLDSCEPQPKLACHLCPSPGRGSERGLAVISPLHTQSASETPRRTERAGKQEEVRSESLNLLHFRGVCDVD